MMPAGMIVTHQGQPSLQHQYAGGVGADAEKRDVGEGEQSEIADHQVEADADGHVHQHHVEDVLLILVQEQRHGQQQQAESQTAGRAESRGDQPLTRMAATWPEQTLRSHQQHR